jgi:hypothetical protein
MKLATIQRIPIRKSAFVKSTPNSKFQPECQLFNEDSSMEMRKFDNSSELQTQKRIFMTKGFVSVIAILPDKSGNQVGMGWIDAWFHIQQIFTKSKNPRFCNII